jgi:PAS domain S-box-containing protein
MSTTKIKSDIELTAQEGNYKHMFLFNPTPMWIFDQETLEFLEVNDAALIHYGYSREEFLSLNAKDIRPQEEVPAPVEDIELMNGKANHAGDWIHKKKNGDLIIVNIVSHPFVFRGKEARHVMATDVTEQRLIERELKNSEERFRLIVEGAPDPIFIQSDGKFVYLNQTAISLFEVETADQLIGKNVIDYIHQESREVVLKRMKLVNDDRQSVSELVEIRFISSKGNETWVETAGQPLDYGGMKAGLVFVRDISNRKKTVEALNYQEYLLKEMGRIAKIGGWEFDPNTGKGTWTDEVARIHGLKPGVETNVEKGISFYKDDSYDKIVAAIKNAIEQRVAYDLELEMIDADGLHKWVHTFGHPVMLDGKVIKVRGSFQDITQRKHAEKALIESEHKYRAFFENSLDAMLLTTPEGQVLEVNEAACKLWGYSEAELKGLRRDQIVDADNESYNIFIEKRAKAGIAVGELRIIRKDGSLVDTEVSSAIFTDANDKKKNSLIVRDISKRKGDEQRILQLNAELEEKIEERTAQLIAVNRDLEAFAYSVSHDLRAPLRSINGLTQILQDNYSNKLENEGLRLTERIRVNSTKMGTLIEDLLSFSKASTSEIRKTGVDMNSLVEGALNEIGEKDSLNKIEFRISNLPDTEGDPTLLKQVWVNLISNAVKFSARKETPIIEISGHINGYKCFFKIKDNGAGFNMKYSDKIFAAFQRLHTEQEFQGTGAGLAIVQRILLKHGGNIWAEGEEGVGATFTFCLPIKKKGAE